MSARLLNRIKDRAAFFERAASEWPEGSSQRNSFNRVSNEMLELLTWEQLQPQPTACWFPQCWNAVMVLAVVMAFMFGCSTSKQASAPIANAALTSSSITFSGTTFAALSKPQPMRLGWNKDTQQVYYAKVWLMGSTNWGQTWYRVVNVDGLTSCTVTNNKPFEYFELQRL